MAKIKFLDENGVVLHTSNKLCNGTIEIIKRSDLTPILCGDVDGTKDDTICAEIVKYEIGDVVFVYHHRKQFMVYKIETVKTINGSYARPCLTEVDPPNPKMPILIFPQYCNYPKVTNAKNLPN